MQCRTIQTVSKGHFPQYYAHSNITEASPSREFRSRSLHANISFSWRNSPNSGLGRLNPLNAELNPICHLLALLGPHLILHISRIRVKERPCANEHISAALLNNLKRGYMKCSPFKNIIAPQRSECDMLYISQSFFIYLFIICIENILWC